MNRLQQAIALIDAVNETDPKQTFFEGKKIPHQVAHAICMTRWIERLIPSPLDALRIAARGQHIARWTLPRESYPMDRAGYLRWREALKAMHAGRVLDIAREAGYDEAVQENIRVIMLKKDIKGDPETQALEDALCLTFLELEFSEFKGRVPDDKMAEILRKTWRKMSQAGHALALSLPFSDEEKEILKTALSEPVES